MSTQKTYLDSAGLAALWSKIQTGFAPRWTAYKPAAPSTDGVPPIDYNMDVDETKGGINFVSAGVLTSGGTKYGSDIRVVVPAAVPAINGSGGTAGLLSSVDKEKIDNMGTTAEGLVTLKGIHVGKNNGTALKIDGNKFAHFNFVYNENTKSLDITDRNSSDAVLATVPIAHFTEDLAISSVISDADVVAALPSQLPADAVVTSSTTTNGPWLKLSFILTREGINASTGADETYTETKTVYTSLADLVSTYTASTGLEVINLANDGVDDTATTAAFRLKSAATGERGGVKVVDVTTGKAKNGTNYVTTSGTTYTEAIKHTTDTGRYFGLERNSEDVAFVNVPIGNLSAADEINVGDQSIDVKENARTNAAQSFTVISGLTVSKDTDCQGNSISYKTKTIEILPETPVTWAADGTGTATTLYDGATFSVVTKVESTSGKNGHELKQTKTAFTFQETELGFGTTVNAADAGDKFVASAGHVTGGTTAEEENISIAGGNSFTYLEDIAVNHHTITKTFKKTVISTPTIPLSVINALSYPVA